MSTITETAATLHREYLQILEEIEDLEGEKDGIDSQISRTEDKAEAIEEKYKKLTGKDINEAREEPVEETLLTHEVMYNGLPVTIQREIVKPNFYLHEEESDDAYYRATARL